MHILKGKNLSEVGVMKQQDTYKEVRVIEFPHGTATVHIPDLTDEERARRMKRIAESAALLLYPRSSKGKSTN